MKILLDANNLGCSEQNNIYKQELDVFFRLIQNPNYEIYIHLNAINKIKLHDSNLLKAWDIHLKNYTLIDRSLPWHEKIVNLLDRVDIENKDDLQSLNEILFNNIDVLISQDKNIHLWAARLGISEKVILIHSFLMKTTMKNKSFTNYEVLAVKKGYFDDIDINDKFFDSFKKEYLGFEKWFISKANEIAYTCKEGAQIVAFLYLKVEEKDEFYQDILPIFLPKRRLKIGTFKVDLGSFRIGERFIKIIYDNAIIQKVDEIYVTIFNNAPEKVRLIELLMEYGFKMHGYKTSISGEEQVYIRDFARRLDKSNPKKTFPYLSIINSNIFLAPIQPKHHTRLFPDSILKTERVEFFQQNEPSSNAISKIYVSRSYERNLRKGDIIIFYRTGGYFKGVITTIGIVENVITGINNEKDFVEYCSKRSSESAEELSAYWNGNQRARPFVVNFLYVYSFPKRINLEGLIKLKVIKNIQSAPRGFQKISQENFIDIMKGTNADESIIVS